MIARVVLDGKGPRGHVAGTFNLVESRLHRVLEQVKVLLSQDGEFWGGRCLVAGDDPLGEWVEVGFEFVEEVDDPGIEECDVLAA